MTTAPIGVRRSEHRLCPDPRRVIAKLFIPGQEGLIEGESRAGSVIDRILALDDDQATAALDEVETLFAGRHHDLTTILTEHFELVAHRINHLLELSPARRQLIGAYFTQEYAVEAAALCNPSIVAHPDQTGMGRSELRFVMSVRAIGEGHLSSIEFRTGTVDSDADVHLDQPGVLLFSGRRGQTHYRRDRFHRLLRAIGDDGSSASFVLDSLPDPFSTDELDSALGSLHAQLTTRRDANQTIERIRRIAASNYEVTFPAVSTIAERVLSPVAPTESRGMEDARFVLFHDDDGTTAYYATYTAYDGAHVAPQLLATSDFRTFTSTQLTGRAATNKGMALFPRRIGGRYVALSRWDRKTNAVVTSDDATAWDDPISLQRDSEPWDIVQVGNCGSPLETDAGWIVLTHGVGPMRRYVIGAELLDIDDPARVIGCLTEPLLAPADDERDGYVPNVVYSCGALLHGDSIVLPYGIGDAHIGVATVPLDQLLDRLTTGPGPSRLGDKGQRRMATEA
ncbi:MAG: glycoside hydrolase family 130 protein [Actinomycetota bacterium]|nr:glycoside hydrolase family 130 protein [Actinomycetota bacterium]